MCFVRFRPAVALTAVVMIVAVGWAAAGEPPRAPPSATSASAPAMMDNPLYAAWAKWKPGASVTLRGGFADRTCRVTMENAEAMPFTLLSATAEAVRVRLDIPQPDPVLIVPAKVSLGRFRLAGLRRVTVAGRTFTCKMYNGPDAFGNGEGDDCRWMYWLSDDVPGGIVKLGGTTGCCGQIGYFAATLVS